MENKKVLLIVAPHNFRDEEYFETKKVLEENNIVVKTASKDVDVATGKLGEEIDVDLDVIDVNVDEFDGFVFIGGQGAYDYIEDEDVLDLVKEIAEDESKVLAAICIAPMILFAAGVLTGKQVTVWNGDNKQSRLMINAGVDYVDNYDVIDDENIVTANGYEVSREFGEAIVNKLEELE
jgi:protease I